MFFTIINAPFKGLVFTVGKPGRTLGPGFHITMPWESVRRVSTALHTEEVSVDVITRGGTPTQVKVGFSGRVVDIEGALVNTQNPFAAPGRTKAKNVLSRFRSRISRKAGIMETAGGNAMVANKNTRILFVPRKRNRDRA